MPVFHGVVLAEKGEVQPCSGDCAKRLDGFDSSGVKGGNHMIWRIDKGMIRHRLKDESGKTCAVVRRFRGEVVMEDERGSRVGSVSQDGSMSLRIDEWGVSSRVQIELEGNVPPIYPTVVRNAVFTQGNNRYALQRADDGRYSLCADGVPCGWIDRICVRHPRVALDRGNSALAALIYALALRLDRFDSVDIV